MPRKIRDLIRDLRRAGFELLKDRGKGDHQIWQHPDHENARVGLDGKPGSDAKPYQEDDLKKALDIIQRAGK
jgi:predicted RNA binding protein YcfA (HicA-like mRNA interferase family)